ncbi:metabotropic glutamate receptor 6 [Biomphalaria glabrata]|nr:metabotropic glutamate receptor 6-like; partial [Biomphalaria glabrata]
MKCSSIECYHDMLREKYHTNPSQTLLIKLAVYGFVRTLSEFMKEHCPDTLSDQISCFNQQSSQFASFFKEIATDSEMRDAYLYNSQGQVMFLQWSPHAENEMIGLMSYNLFEQTIRRIKDLDVKPFRFPPEFLRSAGNCKPMCSLTEYHFAVSHCCWVCKKCADNELATESQDHCEPCPMFYWPTVSGNETTCLEIEPDFYTRKDPLVIVLLFVTAFGASLTLVVFY